MEPPREAFCLQHQVDLEELQQQVLDLEPNKSLLMEALEEQQHPKINQVLALTLNKSLVMEALEEQQHPKINLKAKASVDLAAKATKAIIQEDLAVSKMQVEGSSTKTKPTTKDLELKVRAKALEEPHRALLPRAKDFLSKIRIKKEEGIKAGSSTTQEVIKEAENPAEASRIEEEVDMREAGEDLTEVEVA